MCLSETHVTDDFDKIEYDIPGYRVIECNSTSVHTGGVLIYVREDATFSVVKIDTVEMEYWAVAIRLQYKKLNCCVAGLYASPNGSSALFVNYVSNLGEQLMDMGIGIIMLGDWNLDWSKDEFYTRKIKEVVQDLGLKQHIKQFTRVTPTTNTIIDVVVSNMKEIECEVQMTPRIADHGNILVKIKNVNGECGIQGLVRKVTIDYVKLLSDLDTEKARECNCDVDRLWEALYAEIKGGIEEATVEKMWRINRESKPWFGVEIKNILGKRDKAYESFSIMKGIGAKGRMMEMWERYKEYRNKAVALIRSKKRQWYARRINETNQDPSMMWKVLKQLVCGKSKDKILEVEFNGEVVKDCMEVANKLNIFFVESIGDILGI